MHRVSKGWGNGPTFGNSGGADAGKSKARTSTITTRPREDPQARAAVVCARAIEGHRVGALGGSPREVWTPG